MILETIKNNLPNKPYCSNQLGYLTIKPKLEAIKHSYLQYNHNDLSTLIYDLDYDVNPYEDFVENIKNPTPNVVSINQENGHAHAFYCLKNPVYQSNFEQMKNKSYRFACRVDNGLTKHLKADFGYTKLIAKSVWNDCWKNYVLHDHLFPLETLADYLEKSELDARKKIEPMGLGRNCNVFDLTRKWAYREIREGWLSYDFFFQAVENQALEFNLNMLPPLNFREVKSIAKSVSKWVWKNMSNDSFIDYQKRQNQRSIASRRALQDKKIELVKDYKLINPEATVREISDFFGYSVGAIFEYLKKI